MEVTFIPNILEQEKHRSTIDCGKLNAALINFCITNEEKLPGLSHQRVIIEINGEVITPTDWNTRELVNEDEVTITPSIGGSNAGVITTIVGAALVFASFAIYAVPALWWMAPASPSMFLLGMTMMAGGVVTMLTPKPSFGMSSAGGQQDLGTTSPTYAWEGEG